MLSAVCGLRLCSRILVIHLLSTMDRKSQANEMPSRFVHRTQFVSIYCQKVALRRSYYYYLQLIGFRNKTFEKVTRMNIYQSINIFQGIGINILHREWRV
jgi:hypothetical protein